MASHLSLSDADLDAIVRSALRKEAPIDTLVTRALWGDDVPPVWGEWPERAKLLWSAACRQYYSAANAATALRKRWTPNPLTWGSSWDLIFDLAPDPAEWWLLPGVTWVEIADRMGAGVTLRSAIYRLQALGWRMLASNHTVLLQPSQAPAGLPRQQAAVLEFLRAYDAEHGMCPTFSQIGEALGLSPNATVHEHMANLRARGYITAINRRVTGAPCARCGQPWRPPEFHGRLGPCCARGAA